MLTMFLLAPNVLQGCRSSPRVLQNRHSQSRTEAHARTKQSFDAMRYMTPAVMIGFSAVMLAEANLLAALPAHADAAIPSIISAQVDVSSTELIASNVPIFNC